MTNSDELCSILRSRANAQALIKGSDAYPDISGRVLFYQLRDGVIVRVRLTGLPKNNAPCKNPIFAFHIHTGTECSGDETDPFANVQGHYNPENCPHPYHAGDMPPLFSVKGRAFSIFLTDRFSVSEILGKTLIIHAMPDDFKTQPSGAAGEKIACGVIMIVACRNA